MTRVAVEATGRRIQPFDDAIGETLIANQPLSYWQELAFREAGLERAQAVDGPTLVVPDTLYTTGPVLKRFVEGAAGRNAVLVLGESAFGRRTTPVQPDVTPVAAGWRFERVRFVSGGGEAPVEVVVDCEEEVLTLDFPAMANLTGDGPIIVPLPRHPVMTLHHWVHVVWANQAAGASEFRRGSKLLGVLRVLWAVLRSLSFNKWKVLARLNRIGRGCDIHPTAVVEGSTLGKGVQVGPFARVLFSRIGDGVSIMPGAMIEASTLGDGVFVGQKSLIRDSVIYPRAFCSFETVQCSIMGRESLATPGSYPIDANFGGTIRVMLDGRLHDTQAKVVGCAVGHRAKVATGIWLASGRAVPNDCLLVGDPDNTAYRIPADTGGERSWTVRGGTMVPLNRAPLPSSSGAETDEA
jgi:carbonic anhydrase/acetyltransferase-like protein (isoleucine patch superfamily)